MLYTPATKRALSYMLACHEGQTDRAGMPYALHPLHLAEHLTYEDEVCVALLHDVMEDCGSTSDDLRAIGMSERVICALETLCHDSAVPYLDYIRTVRENPLASEVKLADLRHNSELSRLDQVGEHDLARLRKYMEARVLLGDMAYELKTPAGSVRFLVNDTPWPFEVVDETRSSINWYDERDTGGKAVGRADGVRLLRVETLPLSVGDMVRVEHDFEGASVDCGSGERVDWFTYHSRGCAVCIGCYDDEEYFDSENAHCYRIRDWSGTYEVVEDPVAHRFRDFAHVIDVRVAWRKGTDDESTAIASWVGGW